MSCDSSLNYLDESVLLVSWQLWLGGRFRLNEYGESRRRHTSPTGLDCTDLELDELVRLEGVSAEDDADRLLGHLDHGAQGQHLVTVVVHEVQNLDINW